MVKHWSIVQVNKFLKDLGYRYSIQREYILKVLFEKSLNAISIKKRVSQKYNLDISLTTIYKQLDTLEKANIVKSEKDKFSEKKLYMLNRNLKQNNLICLTCKKIIEVNTSSFDNLVKDMSNKKDFLVLEYNLSLYGYCKECNDDNKITSRKSN